jgi:hypothetical protein
LNVAKGVNANASTIWNRELTFWMVVPLASRREGFDQGGDMLDILPHTRLPWFLLHHPDRDHALLSSAASDVARF